MRKEQRKQRTEKLIPQDQRHLIQDRRRVVVKYPADGGYTPGDTWVLYVGSDNRVEALEFHHPGSAKPSQLIETWVEPGVPVLLLDCRDPARRNATG